MPWTPAQIRLFMAAAHSPDIAASHGMTKGKAAEMAKEGVKSDCSDITSNINPSLRITGTVTPIK